MTERWYDAQVREQRYADAALWSRCLNPHGRGSWAHEQALRITERAHDYGNHSLCGTDCPILWHIARGWIARGKDD